MIEAIEERIKNFKVIDTFSINYSNEVKEQVKKIILEMEYLIFVIKQEEGIK